MNWLTDRKSSGVRRQMIRSARGRIRSRASRDATGIAAARDFGSSSRITESALWRSSPGPTPMSPPSEDYKEFPLFIDRAEDGFRVSGALPGRRFPVPDESPGQTRRTPESFSRSSLAVRIV